jgi:transcriptional regulator GlxA family with amidase domain
VVRPPYPVELFLDLPSALAWLGQGEHHDAIVGMRASASPPLLQSLQRLFAETVYALPLSRAARMLAMSARTLQRRLAEAGTSYQAELAAARLSAAQHLLLTTDAPITAVAFEVGCSGPAHFCHLFRKRIGESPSRWRKRRLAQ